MKLLLTAYPTRKVIRRKARQMRHQVFRHQLRTRRWKYRSFLRYLRLFKYASLQFKRGEFLESYYTLMRYFDDVADGDAPLPAGYENAVAYLENKRKFARSPVHPKEPADYLLLYALQTGRSFGSSFETETEDILRSLCFDARRNGKWQLFPEKELAEHFHLLDIRGTIRATLKVFGEDPAKYPLLEPLGMACRYHYDLRDFKEDLKTGYINISKEDCADFKISMDDLKQGDSAGIRKWKIHRARQGLQLLEEHHRRLPSGRFSLLARWTFPLVYEQPARKFFLQVLKGTDPDFDFSPPTRQSEASQEHSTSSL